jgi:hypothetical protein
VVFQPAPFAVSFGGGVLFHRFQTGRVDGRYDEGFRLGRGGYLCREAYWLADQVFSFQDRFAFCATVHFHYEVDYVYALHFARPGEAVGGVGFWVDFHRGFAVGVEGAFYRALGSGLQAVVGQDSGDGEGGFDGGNGHTAAVFSFLLQLKIKLIEQSSSKTTPNVPFCKTYKTFSVLLCALSLT